MKKAAFTMMSQRLLNVLIRKSNVLHIEAGWAEYLKKCLINAFSQAVSEVY